MARTILLLYNTPKAKRYFSALRDHVADLSIRVRPLLLRLAGPGLDPAQRGVTADYAMRRQHARYRIPHWRMRLLERGYRQAAQWHFNRARREIERIRPDAVGVWGGQAVDARAAVTACDTLGLPRYIFETGLLPNTTTCDPRGVNFENSVPRDPSFYARYYNRSALPESLLPRVNKRGFAEVALPDHYIFVPFQVRLDSQMLLYSPWIRDMQHLFTVTTEAWRTALAERGYKLVFKLHPSCKKVYPELQAAVARESGLMFANGNSTEELIRRAHGVVTVNSTVGIESLLLDRPVLSLGQACYGIPGVANTAGTIEAISRWMDSLVTGTLPAAINREAFLHYLANEYCIPEHHKTPGQAHFAAIARRLSDASRLVPIPATLGSEAAAQNANELTFAAA